eukprot:15280233-Ditylum_brightwellii.AAC.2
MGQGKQSGEKKEWKSTMKAKEKKKYKLTSGVLTLLMDESIYDCSREDYSNRLQYQKNIGRPRIDIFHMREDAGRRAG